MCQFTCTTSTLGMCWSPTASLLELSPTLGSSWSSGDTGKHDFMDHKDRYMLINRNFELFANISLLKEQVVVNDQDKIGSFLAIKQSMRKELSGLEMQLKAIQSKLDPVGMSRPSTPSCSVCVTDLAPPAAITQCRGGHLACGACTSRLSVCPACEGAWDGRAVGLESFLRETGHRV